MSSDRVNSFWLSVQYVITIILFLLIIKINLTHFGSEKYGIWIILSSIWGFGASIDLGFGLTTVKHVAQYKNDNIKMNKILSSFFFIYLSLAIIIFFLGLTVAFSFYFNNTKLVNQVYLAVFKNVFLILGLSFILQYLAVFFKSILEGLSLFYLSSIVTIFQNILIFIGVVLISFYNLSIYYLSYLYLISSLSILCFHYLYYKKYLRIYKISWGYFEWVETGKLFRFSFAIQLMNLSYSMIDPLVKYIIGNYSNVNIVPAYEVARKFATSISGLFFNTFKIILPKSSSLKSSEEIQNFIKYKLTEYSQYGIIYSGMTIGILLLPIILTMNLIFGMKETIIIYLILVLPEAVNNFGFSIYNFFIGVGRLRILTFVQISNLIMMTIGTFMGFYFFNSILGLLGYFFSVVLGNLIMLHYLNKNWYMDFLCFIKRSNLYKLIILLVLIFIALILLYNSWPIDYNYIFAFVSILSLLMFLNQIKEFVKNIFPLFR
ncbi:MAG: hypothetical protein AB1432_02235 [Bacteroidota bacterium]